MTWNHTVELAKPFPREYVKDDGRGNDYVRHDIVLQRMIQIFGQPPKIEILREIYDEAKLTGVVMRLTVPGFDPVEEAGEADNPQSKTNGARAKDACSDAIKRCAMRLGLGLHLWSQDNYFLYKVLTRGSESSAGSASAEPKAASTSGDHASQPEVSAGSEPAQQAPNSWAEEETGGSPAPGGSGPSSSSLDWRELCDRYGKAVVLRTARDTAKDLKVTPLPSKAEDLYEIKDTRVLEATSVILAERLVRT